MYGGLPMSRAPLVALIALIGFVALVALGVGWTPRIPTLVPSGPASSRGLDKSDSGIPQSPAVTDTGAVLLSTTPAPEETLQAILPDVSLERPESSCASDI